MKATFTFPAVIAIVSIIFFSGCTKYEQNGSLLHFRSPEKRILGTWNSVRVQEVGVESDTNMTELLGSNNLQLSLEFRDDQTITIINEGEELNYEGEWLFNDDNSILQMNISNSKQVGPFYSDSAGIDQTTLVHETAEALMQPDTFFFAGAGYIDITDSIMPLAMLLMSEYSQFFYTGGNSFYNFEIGDDVTDVMGDFIDDLLSEGIIESADDTNGIIDGMLSEYGVNLSYSEVSAQIEGLGDPNLSALLLSNFGVSATVFMGQFAASQEDPIVLDWIAANIGIDLTSFFIDELKELSIYWKLLELELDDLQAYQFREFDGETIYDYSYLLRFEKING